MTKDVRAEIEEAIRKDPHDPEPYLVLADLLQTTGDPRGELISVQQALAGVPTSRLRELEEDLLEQYQEALLGPLHTALTELGPLPGRQMVGLEWRHGFLRKVTLRVRDRGEQLVAIVRAIAASPAAKFLEAFDATLRGSDTDEVVDAIVESMPATLRDIAITTTYDQIDLTALWPRMTELRSVRIVSRDGRCVLGDVPTDKLELLEVNSIDAEDADAFLAKKLPKLRSLTLAIHGHSGDSGLALLDGSLPQLTHLGLVRYDGIDVARLRLGKLESLRLAAISTATLRAVIAAGKDLKALDLGFVRLEPDELAPIFAGALPKLVHLGLGPTDPPMHDLGLLGRAKILPKLESLTLRDFPSYQIDSLAGAKKLAKVPRIDIYCPNLERGYRAKEMTAAQKKMPNLRLVRQTV